MKAIDRSRLKSLMQREQTRYVNGRSKLPIKRATKVDADYVRKMLADIVKDQDLSRYLL